MHSIDSYFSLCRPLIVNLLKYRDDHESYNYSGCLAISIIYYIEQDFYQAIKIDPNLPINPKLPYDKNNIKTTQFLIDTGLIDVDVGLSGSQLYNESSKDTFMQLLDSYDHDHMHSFRFLSAEKEKYLSEVKYEIE